MGIKTYPGLVILFFVLALGIAQDLPSFFSTEDIALLEKLVLLAQQHDLASMSEEAKLDALSSSFSLEGRLSKALSISGSASLSGDVYGQAVPSYSVSVGLDVMKLLNSEGNLLLGQQSLLEARLKSRLRVVEAFVGYKVAVLSAETSARALEAAEARFRVSSERVRAGESILSEQIAAQSELAKAGLELYRANGQVIIGLESLAGVVGVSLGDLVVLLEASHD